MIISSLERISVLIREEVINIVDEFILVVIGLVLILVLSDWRRDGF